MKPSDVLAQLVERTAKELGEHFDAVQILACGADPDRGGGTYFRVYEGSGNWFARVQMARDFVEIDAAQRIAESISDELNKSHPGDDEDDGEDDKQSWQTPAP